jgi:uncharacterized protein YigE (DUF2233 family)
MRFSIFLFILLVSNICFAQVLEKINYNYDQATFDIVILKIDSNLAKQTKILENTTLSAGELKDSLFNTGNAFLAINAAPTDASGNLLGLFISQGQVKQTINNTNGTGNFFLKPNGFWSIGKNNMSILSSDKYIPANSHFHAVQSGPMLVAEGTINKLFDPVSQNKNIRLGMGIYSKNNTYFLVIIRSQSPVTFYSFASLFKDKFNCNNALYLDGGEQSMLLMPSNTFRGTTGNLISKLLLIKII